MIYSLLLLAFTLMIWFVLYKIPDRFGLISKRENKERLALDQNVISASILLNIPQENKERDSKDIGDPRRKTVGLQEFINIAKEEETHHTIVSLPPASNSGLM